MTKFASRYCYTVITERRVLGGIVMALAKKIKSTFSSKGDSGGALAQGKQLNKYILSQFFIQLVNFQQLIKSMNDFIGDESFVKTATLFEGLSLCLNKTMSEMLHDRYDVESQIEMIRKKMQNIGVKATDIQIKSLYPRLIKLSMVVDKPTSSLLSGKLKAQLEELFTEPLKINIGKVKNKTMRIQITSSRNFKIEHGVAYIGKHGNKVSGDNYLCENFQNGKSIIAISDGMGNGEIAHAESSLALRVLKCMLSFDVPVDDAIRVLAELKQQNNADERFFSLDLCVVDKENGCAHFYKQAATSTFLLRRDIVRKIEMSGLPIGVVDGAGIDQMIVDLLPGDIIVMCSDGVVDAFAETDLFEKRIIRNIDNDMNNMTQDLLDYTIRRSRGVVNDDMMVVAAQYKSIRDR